MSLVGYARANAGGQEFAVQTEALTTAGCDRIPAKTVSGALGERSELERMMDLARVTPSWFQCDPPTPGNEHPAPST